MLITPLFTFCPLSEAEVSKRLLSSHPTTCPLDPIPSHLLQAISPTLLPALTHIIDTSLLTGTFPTAFKEARRKHSNESFLTRYHYFLHRTVHWMLTSLGSGVATRLKLHYYTLTITPSSSARNLGVIFDDQLTFKDHKAKTARSCRFALHNIRKIRSFLTEQATQLLVQALVISRLDYCNALLAVLPSCTIKPLQMIQNAAARLVFNEHKRAHVMPHFITLHWLPVAAHIKFKTLMLAYRTATGSAPGYLHSLLPIYTPFRTLRSTSE
ncbi:Huntingtin [Labeo rohita]|uniref:Huntingtin n=1 Tax=Labeo rohita TaxID=84645 RepID=A0ABQ8L3I1_LABRO|nr:Huntingtin [Labeo rohita]